MSKGHWAFRPAALTRAIKAAVSCCWNKIRFSHRQIRVKIPNVQCVGHSGGGQRVGSDLMRRPPKFVNGYIDRHNKPRFYFRRAGFKRVPLPGLPWSPEFMAVYEQALAGQPTPVGAARVLPGTIRTDLNGVLHHRPKNLPESICAIRLFSS
jgi:hypothetical protein